MRKVYVVLAMVLCFLLTGCGASNTVSKDKSFDEEPDGALAGAHQYTGSTVKVATWADWSSNGSDDMQSTFYDRFGIEVVPVTVPQGDYITKVSGLIGAGQSPDVILDNLEFPNAFALAQPLNDIASINVADPFWSKSVMDMATIDNKIYFIDSENSPSDYRFMCFYNKKLFEDYGIKNPGKFYEENNWTIDTFEECARQIDKLGDEYVGASVRPEFASGIWETSPILYSEGKFVSGLSDTRLAEAYKWMLSGREEGIFVTTSASVQFNANLCGLFLYGDHGLRSDGGFETMDPDVLGYVPMPKVKASDAYYPSVSSWHAYGICKGSKNAEAAGYYLRYSLDPANHNTKTKFKSEAASNFYDELREIEVKRFHMFSGAYEGNDKIVASTSAQVDTVLKTLENSIEARVKRNNAVLKKVK